MAAWYVATGLEPPATPGPNTRGCLGKHAYLTKHSAELARIALYRRPGFIMGSDGRPGRLETYRCAKCSSFHLGRDPRQTFKPRTQP